MRLFCFPYGGGGASVFRQWGLRMPSWVEVCALVLPGRELRLRETPYTRLPPLVEAIAKGMGDALDLPFAFFGHSMGALVCFELAHHLTERDLPLPRALFVAGSEAPHLRQVQRKTYDLGDAEFLQELRKYNGTPRDVLENQDYMKIVLPTIRADFSVVQTYTYERQRRLPVDIIALGGRDDPSVSFDKVGGWHEHTTHEFELHSFSGDHFFINSSRDQVVALIRKTLEARMGLVHRSAR